MTTPAADRTNAAGWTAIPSTMPAMTTSSPMTAPVFDPFLSCLTGAGSLRMEDSLSTSSRYADSLPGMRPMSCDRDSTTRGSAPPRRILAAAFSSSSPCFSARAVSRAAESSALLPMSSSDTALNSPRFRSSSLFPASLS